MNWRYEMSKPMKRSAFFLSTAMVGLLAAYAPASWANENHDQHSQKSSDATQSHGSKSKQAQGMDHDSMEGMDHGKMMEAHGSEKAEAGKNGQ
ncbi:hypothetical protein G1E_15284 [Pseudomonas sp. TJI-51]|jgi:uncharacterized protein involved in copper resistance|nr:hypothetical protein [Pseudomonas sp.]EGB98027.2 hypothetical protein G1E_15284 [Pseudomonas sp. TJI-51]MBA6122127.1 hypothetical protein [Pseudomonas juntendi]QDR69551.1 hypothetical protein FPB55_18995 [Pseudomonas sp. BJP69]RRV74345.1 hypothetical protein EGJ15_06070 [Pseudomonas sp. p99-361]MBH3373724.1 hypothetical protein [Pseudomonas juntendi]